MVSSAWGLVGPRSGSCPRSCIRVKLEKIRAFTQVIGKRGSRKIEVRSLGNTSRDGQVWVPEVVLEIQASLELANFVGAQQSIPRTQSRDIEVGALIKPSSCSNGQRTGLVMSS